MTPRKKVEPKEEDSQTVKIDGDKKTLEFTNRGKSGLVLVKALAFVIVILSLAGLIYSVGYMLDVVGKHFFRSVGAIVWAFFSLLAAWLLRWPQSH
jgi:hypothetical protein